MISKHTCFRCGIEYERQYQKQVERHFCSRSCNMKQMNAERNPTRMTQETREKVSKKHKEIKQNTSKSYKKHMGRHIHRIVAEEKIGRSLKKGEIVHHIDGNILNNDPSNLEVLESQALHAAIHVRETGYCAGKKVGDAQ